MPRFQITAPDGRQITIEGDTAPTQAEAEQIFASAKASPKQRPPHATLKGTGRDEGLRGMGGMMADIAIEGVPATVGAVVGAPAGPIGAAAGAAIGGILGNIGAQSRRILADEQAPEFKTGQILASGVTNAVPLGAIARPTLGVLAKEAVIQAAAGGAGKTLETLVDEERLPGGGEIAASTLLPAAGGATGAKLAGKNADLLGKTERATLEAAKREGYVVTPSSVSDSSVNRRLESIAGKAAVGQAAAIQNQEVTNKLAKQALGLPDTAELTMATLRKIRDDEALPYKQIEQMAGQAKADLDRLIAQVEQQAGGDRHQLAVLMASPQVNTRMKPLLAESAADIDALREARNEATRQFAAYRQNASPEALEKARAASELADTLENRIDMAVQSVGDPDLLQRLRNARTRIAKTYDVERALNIGNAEVAAPIIARQLDKGRPLTGELETIGKFTEAFPSVMREGSKVPTPGVSKVEAGTAALLATLGVGSTQSPYGAAIGMLPLLSGPTRSLLLSRPYQRLLTAEPFAMPKTSEATRAASQAAGQEVTRDDDKKKSSTK